MEDLSNTVRTADLVDIYKILKAKVTYSFKSIHNNFPQEIQMAQHMVSKYIVILL